MIPGGGKEHSRLWLSAVASIGVIVVTDIQRIDRQVREQAAVDRFNLRPGRRTPSDVGLVRDDNDRESTFVQSRKTARGPVIDM